MMAGEKPLASVEIRGSVGWVTLDRPDRMNAMSRALLEQLLAILQELSGDATVRAVVLTGAGSSFCAGGDLRQSLKEITGDGPIAEQTAELRRFMRTSQLLAEMDKPTIAAVNGACAGGGLGLALAADIRLASENAVFTTGFLTVGVSGDFGTTWGLSRAVGPALARELYLTGRRLGADEALRLGLVSAVHPADELMAAAEAVAVSVARQAPLAVRAIKRNFNALPASLAEVLEMEAARHVRCTNSADAEEARLAFLDKRPPNFERR
jgi:2-(1,2-epoxy-1,2-dihydrophenyl)acetyl-CoA isomerase